MLYVIGVPRIGDLDAAAIAGVRIQHDPQASSVPAHVTLVYAAPVDANAAVEAARHAALAVQPIDACFRRAMVWWMGQGRAWVYLVPDEGFSALSAWHDVLYGADGPFARYRCWNIPFVPHMTLAVTDTVDAARAIADQWNASRRDIAARFESLTVGEQVSSTGEFRVMESFRVGPNP